MSEVKAKETPETLPPEAIDAVKAHAELAADICRLKMKFNHPECSDAECEKKAQARREEVARLLTEPMGDRFRQLKEVAAKIKPDHRIVIALGETGEKMDLQSPKDIGPILARMADVFEIPDIQPHARAEKRYYQTHLELRDTLKQRAHDIKAKKAAPVTDLEMARLRGQAEDMVADGSQLGMSRYQLVVYQQHYELDMLALRPQGKEMGRDDAAYKALAQFRLQEATVALAQEKLLAEQRVAETIPAPRPAEEEKKATTPAPTTPTPAPPEDKNGKDPEGNPLSSVMEQGRKLAQATLAGDEAFVSEFNMFPASRAAGKKAGKAA